MNARSKIRHGLFLDLPAARSTDVGTMDHNLVCAWPVVW